MLVRMATTTVVKGLQLATMASHIAGMRIATAIAADAASLASYIMGCYTRVFRELKATGLLNLELNSSRCVIKAVSSFLFARRVALLGMPKVCPKQPKQLTTKSQSLHIQGNLRLPGEGFRV